MKNHEDNTILKILKTAMKPIYAMLQRPSLRYTGTFLAVESLFNLLPYEQLTKTVMEFVAYSNLEGDYLEFGVFEGAHFTAAFHFARLNKLDSMRFYAFDSFQGLPEITGVDRSAPRQFSRGEFACDVDRFHRIISGKGVEMKKVEVIAGWFDATLKDETKRRLQLRKAAVIWIDCDLYESTVPVLDFIVDYVQDGTVLIFDDWFCFHGNPMFGQQKAFQEWLERNPLISATEFYKYGWAGISFVLHQN